MPLLPRGEQRSVATQRTKPAATSKPSTNTTAAVLVSDTIVLRTAEEKRHQAETIQHFKLERCTPRRQRAAIKEQQQQQHLSPCSHASSRRVSTSETPDSMLMAMNVTASDMLRTPTPLSQQQMQQHNAAATSSSSSSPSAAAAHKNVVGTSVVRLREKQRQQQQQQQQQQVHGVAAASPSPDRHRQLQQQQQGAAAEMASVARELDAFTMNFASEQERYERRRNELDAQSDRSSSTDSIVVDPNVLSTHCTKNANRRAARLRDHYTASIDTLNAVSTSTSAGGAGGGASAECAVVLAYLMGLERLVSFCFNTLNSKEELARVIAAIASAGGLAEQGAQGFGRWPCFNADAMHRRLEKVLPVKFDRKALFDCFAGVLRDGRVVHACLLSGLRLLYYSPSAAHFLEFFLTVMFVHQASITQLDCQTVYRVLATPHPLRFLVRGRKDVFAAQEAAANAALAAAAAAAAAAEADKAAKAAKKAAAAAAKQTAATTTPPSERDPLELTLQSSRSGSFIASSPSARFAREVDREKQRLIAGLESAACDVDRRVATEECYYFFQYVATAGGLPGGAVSWTDLQRLVTPPADELDLPATLLPSAQALALEGDGGGGGVGGGPAGDSSHPHHKKELEKQKRQRLALQRRQDQALEAGRKMMRGDAYAATDRIKHPFQCVIVAKLMSELRQP